MANGTLTMEDLVEISRVHRYAGAPPRIVVSHHLPREVVGCRIRRLSFWSRFWRRLVGSRRGWSDDGEIVSQDALLVVDVLYVSPEQAEEIRRCLPR